METGHTEVPEAVLRHLPVRLRGEESSAVVLGLAHGVFNVVSGAWPVLNIGSFEAITGKKADEWLVKTVGLLLVSVGAVQIQASKKGRLFREMSLLGFGTAGSLSVIDLIYASKRRISAVYFLDAVAQLFWTGMWAKQLFRGHTDMRRSGHIHD